MASAAGASRRSFVGDIGYAVQENDHTILAFEGTDATTAYSSGRPVPGALSVLAVHDTLLAIGAHRIVGQFATNQGWPPSIRTAQDLTHRGAPATEPIRVKGLPLAASPAGVWARAGGQLIQQDLAGRQIGARVELAPRGDASPVPGPDPAQVVVDKAGGLYVAVNHNAADNLLYYSPAALDSSNPQPTAVHISTDRITSITEDPSGGVVFTGSDLGRWNPAAK